MEPKFVGDQTGLHPLVSLMSLYVGIKLGGIFGMIVAPVVCLIVVELIRAGFFTESYEDFTELIRRIMNYTEMFGGKKQEAKEADNNEEEDNMVQK